MKKSGKCSKCGSGEIFYSEKALGGLLLGPLVLKTEPSRGYHNPSGILEAYACKVCGYAELYVKDVETLSK